AMHSGPVLTSSRSMSSTITRVSAPICGAARPMPGAAYIVSSMSSISWRTAASTEATALAFFLRRGSGAVRMVRTAMTLKYSAKSTISRQSGALDHGPQAALGEDLEQQGVRDPPVQDGRRLDPAIHRVDAVLDLGDHAARDGAVDDQRPRPLDRHFRNELAVLVQHARHVSEEQQTLGLHRTGDRAGRGVGVDVVGQLVVDAKADRRHHRDDV